MDNNYGKLLYEYSDAKHPLDMSKNERKRYIKSFTAIWILICALLLTAWCVVNFIFDLRLYGKSAVIKSYVILFIILGVVILITVLTVFGLWGIFMRKVGKYYRPHEIESRRRIEELQSELNTADENKNRENALMIYDGFIVIKNRGQQRVIDRKELSVCHMIKSRAGVFLVFYVQSDKERIPMGFMPPASDAYLIKKYLGDKLEEIKVPKGKRRKGVDKKNADNHTDNSDNDSAKNSAPKRNRPAAQIEKGSLVAGICCIVVGIFIVLMGYFHIMGDMPAVVGGFPIALGLMFGVLAFHRYEIVNAFLIKFAAAALLIFMGLLFLIIIESGVTKSPVTVSSLLRHPTVYGLACLFFVSVGISIIPNSVKSLIEYIKYR